MSNDPLILTDDQRHGLTVEACGAFDRHVFLTIWHAHDGEKEATVKLHQTAVRELLSWLQNEMEENQ